MFSLNSVTKILRIKGIIVLKPAASCLKNPDTSTVPDWYSQWRGSLNWALFMFQWFFRFPEFTEFQFYLGKTPFSPQLWRSCLRSRYWLMAKITMLFTSGNQWWTGASWIWKTQKCLITCSYYWQQTLFFFNCNANVHEDCLTSFKRKEHSRFLFFEHHQVWRILAKRNPQML